jgi:hypothetical protein
VDVLDEQRGAVQICDEGFEAAHDMPAEQRCRVDRPNRLVAE